ncbi:MAG: alpha-L-fucosidase [Bryobacteraceae bacterium]
MGRPPGLSWAYRGARGSAAGDRTPQALKKFDDIKFGMFIHWGLYALPAGEWKGKYVRGIGEWIMFREKIPAKEYEQRPAASIPSSSTPISGRSSPKTPGCVIASTSKHHDGFATRRCRSTTSST